MSTNTNCLKFRKKVLYIELAAILDELSISREYIPEINKPNQKGRPYILLYPNHYELVVMKSNGRLKYDYFNDRTEFIYHVIKRILRIEANLYDIVYREKGQSSEHLVHERQLKLMNQVNPTWARRLEMELGYI